MTSLLTNLSTIESLNVTNIPSPLFVLRATGMVTALGNSTAQTLTSWVAQTRRLRKVTLPDFADPFTVIDCERVTSGLLGGARIAAMLESAVIEAQEGADYLASAGSGECLEILVLPSWVSDADVAQLDEQLTSWLSPCKPWRDQAPERLLIRADALGAWVALEHAYRICAMRPAVKHVMIAAGGSECEPGILKQAAEIDILMRTGNGEGYIPGEGAACIFLECVENAGQIPEQHFALHRPAFSRSAAPLWPKVDYPDGGALGDALAAALSSAGMGALHISHLNSDMDGSAWRSTVESTALNRTIFNQTSELPQWRHATMFGQAGTASGFIGWLLPILSHQQRLDQINTVLSWSVEPSGASAACVLERSPY